LKHSTKFLIQNRPCFLCTLYLLLTFAFWPALSLAAQSKLTIFTVNYPLQYFAERIAGEHANVIFPAPADGNPAYWMPDTKTIADYQQADLILLNGAHYAKWVEKVSLPSSKLVDTARKFKDQYIYSDAATTHSHGPEGAHTHESLAFTTWLDFSLAAQQAKAIEKALSRKRPQLKDAFLKNYTALEKDLLALDRKLKEMVSNKPNQPLIGSHPVYDYLAKGYALNLKSVHWEPNEAPSFQQWQRLEKMLTDHPAKWILWEGEPLPEVVNKLKSIGVKSLVYDPCGNVPAKGDFLDVMLQNIKNMKAAF